MDRVAWRAAAQSVAKSRTRQSERAHTHTHTHSNAQTPSQTHPEIIQRLFTSCIWASLHPSNINNKINHFSFKHIWRGYCLVTQSCPTLGNPMDCSPPGSSVHGIFQKRILEWVVLCFSRGSS